MSSTDWEALLRQRLLPCQLADLEATGSFCVRAFHRSGYNAPRKGHLYRVMVTDEPLNCDGARLIDDEGRARAFWFYDGLDASEAEDYERTLKGAEFALAAKALLEGDADRFGACGSGYYRDALPVNYDGAI